MLNISDKWQDYEIITTSQGYKLERFGNIILSRPDPSIIWKTYHNELWEKAVGIYYRSSKGGGHWEFKNKIPNFWNINYKNLCFKISPTNFKHTGIFPEQATNWDFIIEKISNCKKKNIKVLNLFAYTGCATMAASYAGAHEVVHVDASKNINEWAKENMKLCGLENNKIRFITEDVIKFLDREIRRGNKYDAIIMDPPSYGRGPNKEVWKFENNFDDLLYRIKKIISDDFLFILISSYTTGISSISLHNILKINFEKLNIETGELGLPVVQDNLVLPCGIYGKITKN